MGLRTIYRMSSEQQSAPFCRCVNRRPTTSSSSRKPSQPCVCGEFDCRRIDWTWSNAGDSAEEERPSTRVSDNGTNVLFHPVYSQGTAVVRSGTPLCANHIHYWEVKVTSCMSGTDTMIGVGTSSVNLNSHQYKFASFLGLDDQSWGYSYRGLVQHQGRMKYYGKKFSVGCIVGVYVDTFKGQLEFFINRRSQGIAYRNLTIAPGTLLYPMISSTSAKSSVKLINAIANRESLQFQCMKVIGRYPELVQKAQQIPGLRLLCRDTWFLQCKEQYQYNEFRENNLLLEDDVIICGLEGKKKRRLEQVTSTSEQILNENDIYNDLTDTTQSTTSAAVYSSSSSDDESIKSDLTTDLIHGVHFLL